MLCGETIHYSRRSVRRRLDVAVVVRVILPFSSPLSRLSRNIISGDHQRPDCRRHRWVGRVDRQKKATRLSVFPSVCRRYGAVVGGLNDLFLHHSSFLPVVYPFSLTPDLELAPTQRGEHMVSSAG